MDDRDKSSCLRGGGKKSCEVYNNINDVYISRYPRVMRRVRPYSFKEGAVETEQRQAWNLIVRVLVNSWSTIRMCHVFRLARAFQF